jgi:hypothetical protein
VVHRGHRRPPLPPALPHPPPGLGAERRRRAVRLGRDDPDAAPLGYDPAAVWPEGPHGDDFAVIRMEAWRVRLRRGTDAGAPFRVWTPRRGRRDRRLSGIAHSSAPRTRMRVAWTHGREERRADRRGAASRWR